MEAGEEELNKPLGPDQPGDQEKLDLNVDRISQTGVGLGGGRTKQRNLGLTSVHYRE